MVFQDPYASLIPRMTVGDIVASRSKIHKPLDEAESGRRARSSCARSASTRIRQSFPHEFSGGQRQRIGIARASP